MISAFFYHLWIMSKPFLWSPAALVILVLLVGYLIGLLYQKITGGRF